MSQSTNIEYNKTGQNLLFYSDYKGPLKNSDYVRFKSYQLGNTITNSVPTLNELVPPNKVNVFDISRDPSGCPQYNCSSNTPPIKNPNNLTIPVIVPPNLSVPTGVITNITSLPLTQAEKTRQKYYKAPENVNICTYTLNKLRGKNVC